MPIAGPLWNKPVRRLRGAMLLALSDTAIVQARTATSDAGGGAAWAWSDVVTVPCRLAPLTNRPRDRLTGGQINERSTHVCVIPPGAAAVDVGNRLLIQQRGTFEVTGVRVRSAAATDTFEVMQID